MKPWSGARGPVPPSAGCHGDALAGLSPNSRRGGRRDVSPGAASGAAATGGPRPALARIRVGVHRPAAGHPGPLAHRSGPRGPRRDLPGRVLHDRPGDRRDQAAAGRTRVRRPATTMPAPAHPRRRVRLRRGPETSHCAPAAPEPRSAGRRPDGPGRAAFVSGKRRQNTIKTTTISDGHGRALWCGAVRPGRMHEQTAMRTEGIAEQLRLCPRVKAEGRRRLPGTCQRVPRPGEHSAPQAASTRGCGT